MRLDEIVSKMSKLYLGRLIDSFLKDVTKDSEEKMRELILKNKDEFEDYDRIENKLNFIDEDRNTGLLNDLILNILLDENGYILEEGKLIDKVKQKEKEIIQESEKEDSLKYSDQKALQTYERVLRAAWKWQNSISSNEQNMLNVLKKELDLSVYEHRILESKLGYFPQPKNKIHGLKKIKNSFKNLQYRGLVARIRDGETYYVIPQEIAEKMRDILGIELRKDAYTLLLKKLKNNQLSEILRENSLPVSGTKEELYKRILQARIKPSQALNSLTKDELSDILRSLEDVKISGTKDEKIGNIIDFYNSLITYSVETEDEREQYYNYIVELAQRDYEQLRGNDIIDKDREIEQYFEKATEFLFEVLLGYEPKKMKGKDNPDGRLNLNKNEVVLWDNKSCENDYKFPEDHYKQFSRYINDENKRVNVFLIIAPSFTKDCVKKAQKLKTESERDTDVGLITAEGLQFVAKNWRDYCSKSSEFSLQVFNYTGRLTKDRLKQRMSWAIE